jgi:hypothetical protein
MDQSAEEWCRANIHAQCVSECVVTLKRTMVETVGDLLFLVPSARALHHLDMSTAAGHALWNALAPCSEHQARQQLEAESATKTATGYGVTGFAAPKMEPKARQKRTGMKTTGNSRRTTAVEPVVQQKCTESEKRAHQSTSKKKTGHVHKHKDAAEVTTKDATHTNLRSDSRQSKSLVRSRFKHKRGQPAKAPKPKIATKASGITPEDDSAPSISESDGDISPRCMYSTKSSRSMSPRLREEPVPVRGGTKSRPGSLSQDDQRMSRERLVSATSKSVQKRQCALTPPPMPPMTPTRPTARISRLQQLASPSPIRNAQLEPELDLRSGGPTLSRAERLKAQERLLSPAVPRGSESPERRALNVRNLPIDASARLNPQTQHASRPTTLT